MSSQHCSYQFHQPSSNCSLKPTQESKLQEAHTSRRFTLPVKKVRAHIRSLVTRSKSTPTRWSFHHKDTKFCPNYISTKNDNGTLSNSCGFRQTVQGSADAYNPLTVAAPTLDVSLGAAIFASSVMHEIVRRLLSNARTAAQSRSEEETVANMKQENKECSKIMDIDLEKAFANDYQLHHLIPTLKQSGNIEQSFEKSEKRSYLIDSNTLNFCPGQGHQMFLQQQQQYQQLENNQNYQQYQHQWRPQKQHYHQHQDNQHQQSKPCVSLQRWQEKHQHEQDEIHSWAFHQHLLGEDIALLPVGNEHVADLESCSSNNNARTKQNHSPPVMSSFREWHCVNSDLHLGFESLTTDSNEYRRTSLSPENICLRKGNGTRSRTGLISSPASRQGIIDLHASRSGSRDDMKSCPRPAKLPKNLEDHHCAFLPDTKKCIYASEDSFIIFTKLAVLISLWWWCAAWL